MEAICFCADGQFCLRGSSFQTDERMCNTNPIWRGSGGVAGREPGRADHVQHSSALTALARLLGTVAAREHVAASCRREEGEGDDA